MKVRERTSYLAGLGKAVWVVLLADSIESTGGSAAEPPVPLTHTMPEDGDEKPDAPSGAEKAEPEPVAPDA